MLLIELARKRQDLVDEKGEGQSLYMDNIVLADVVNYCRAIEGTCPYDSYRHCSGIDCKHCIVIEGLESNYGEGSF